MTTEFSSGSLKTGENAALRKLPVRGIIVAGKADTELWLYVECSATAIDEGSSTNIAQQDVCSFKWTCKTEVGRSVRNRPFSAVVP